MTAAKPTRTSSVAAKRRQMKSPGWSEAEPWVTTPLPRKPCKRGSGKTSKEPSHELQAAQASFTGLGFLRPVFLGPVHSPSEPFFSPFQRASRRLGEQPPPSPRRSHGIANSPLEPASFTALACQREVAVRLLPRQPPQTALALALLALLLTNCGSIGEPLPPLLNIPERSQDLSARQTPEGIVLEWTWPDFTTEGRPLKSFDNFVIHRLEVQDPAAPVPPSWFDSQSQQVAKLGSADLDAFEPGGKITRPLPTAGLTGKFFAFGVRGESRGGRTMGFSNLTFIQVVDPLQAPGRPSLEVLANGVSLKWEAVPRAAAYRVFRGMEPGDEFGEIGHAEGPEFLDTSFEWGKRYYYRVLPLGRSATGEVEGSHSAAVDIVAIDSFPPHFPTDLRVVASESTIELSWRPNSEPDLAEYRVRRSEGAGSYTVIDIVPRGAASYSDTSVETGEAYRYTITAVDRDGNESAPSDAVAAPALESN